MKIFSERGTILAATAILIAILLLVAGSMYEWSNHQMHYLGRLNDSLQARALAEAGLDRALATLSADFNSKNDAGNFPSTTLGGGTYDAAVSTISGRHLVTSTGSYKDTQTNVSAEVNEPTISALSYGIATGGNLIWDPGTGGSSSTITGDLYSAGNLLVEGTVTGDLTAGGTITSTRATVGGTETAGSSTVVSFPTLNAGFYQTIAQANGNYITGNVNYNDSNPIPSSPAGGVIYVTGNIKITGTQSTTSCIVAGGNITFCKVGSSNPTVTIYQFSNYPALVAAGNIVFTAVGNSSDGSGLTATGLIYAGGNIVLSGNHFDNPRFELNGSIIARGNPTTSGLTSHNELILNYVAQNPPGFSTSTTSTPLIVSYNT